MQALSSKQDTLISGTNIKTIDNQSILGSGNITVTPQIDDKTIVEGQDGLETAVGGYEWDETVQTGEPVEYVLVSSSDAWQMTTHTSSQDNSNANTILPHTTLGGCWYNIQQIVNPSGSMISGTNGQPIPSELASKIKMTLVINGVTIWSDLSPSLYGNMSSKYIVPSYDDIAQHNPTIGYASWIRWTYGNGRLTLNAADRTGKTGNAANPQTKDFWYFTYYDVETGTKKTWTTNDSVSVTITVSCDQTYTMNYMPLWIYYPNYDTVTINPGSPDDYFEIVTDSFDDPKVAITSFNNKNNNNANITKDSAFNYFDTDNYDGWTTIGGGVLSYTDRANWAVVDTSGNIEIDYNNDHDETTILAYGTGVSQSDVSDFANYYPYISYKAVVAPQYSTETVHHIEPIDPKFILPLEKEYEEIDSETGDTSNDKVTLDEYELKFEHSEEVESIEDKSEASLAATGLTFSKDGLMGMSINYNSIQIPDPNSIKSTLILDYDTVEALLALLNRQ